MIHVLVTSRMDCCNTSFKDSPEDVPSAESCSYTASWGQLLGVCVSDTTAITVAADLLPTQIHSVCIVLHGLGS